MKANAKILIAEDSMVIRAVVREQLEDEGYTVDEAPDGLTAIGMCRTFQPDAMLLDIEMPGLNGHEVLSRMKNDPALSDIPVVFLTGRTTTDDLVAGLRAGAHDYLKKPFEPAELIARVGGAVHIKQLQDELRRRNTDLDRLARVDMLTEIFNRRHLNEQLVQLGAAARRDHNPLAVILFDIDHFKKVNDTHGHHAGDQVLQQCASRIADAVRSGGVVGRWGGEEFLVILPGADLDSAFMAADRVRRRIRDSPMVLDGREISVTVSGGCAGDATGDTDALLCRADLALYKAKAAGRDRIVTDAARAGC